MRTLESILNTIELIKKKYSNFKIKVASVQLDELGEGEYEKFVELLSTNKVLQLKLDNKGENKIKALP